MELHFYTKQGCPLCDKGYEIVKEIANEYSLSVKIHDIYENDKWLEAYQLMIPVVQLEAVELDYGMLSKQKISMEIDNVTK
ncbi:glutaredoxin [Alkalihalobacillus xiaoxiensis]|uniref:Glutaredoxin n=1 Tax=Shouchella xiaoxiensis TaxID=766895 RepID=A0ABS2SY78_9BACI|nr:glutaredoxin family protein [Shouchella xiaoxiensis]MBM7840486.1 glutaredoxin [Shouchella xiaoxiensis]